VEVGLPEVFDLIGEEDLGRLQLFRGHLMGTVEATFELADPLGIDVEADGPVSLAEGDGNG
jgi:hypothetical protein